MEILVWAWAVASARHSANAAVADASRHRSIRMGTLLSQSRSKRVLAISGFEMPVEAWPIRAKCSGIVRLVNQRLVTLPTRGPRRSVADVAVTFNIWPNTIHPGQVVTHWDESSILPAAT